MLILASPPYCSISVPISKPQAGRSVWQIKPSPAPHNNKQRATSAGGPVFFFSFLGDHVGFFPVVPHFRADTTLLSKHCSDSFVKTIVMKFVQKNKSSPLPKRQGHQ